MNTIRAPSRNSNTSSTGSNLSAVKSQDAPKKVKVTANAQMDLSSFSLSSSTLTPPQTNILNNTIFQQPSTHPQRQQQQQQQQQTRPVPTVRIRSSGAVPTTDTINIKSTSSRGESNHTVRISDGGGATTGRVSRSGGGHAVVRRMAPGSVNGNNRKGTIKVQREGSITSSDDGTISEDSVEDHIQLFSGAGARGLHVVNNPPFGPSSSPASRAGSAIGSDISSGPKIASGASTISRSRVVTSTSLETTTTAKPIRIASGAALQLDTSQSRNVTGTAAVSTGSLSTSLSSSTSSSSLSWVSSPPHKYSETDSADSSVNVTSPKQAAEVNRRSGEAARAHRKIADLEISNKSMLQLNDSLESTIRKQTAVIQGLKLRMQSSQFCGDLNLLSSDTSLPLAQEHIWDHTGQSVNNQIQINSEANLDAAVSMHQRTETERQMDRTFRRLCIMIEKMIFEAKQALDQSMKPAGVKVLSSFDMNEKETMEDDADDDNVDGANQSMMTNEDDIEEHYDNDNDNEYTLNNTHLASSLGQEIGAVLP
ncbi:hypothetical protein BGZ65_004789 [Modicella reniformis]|uniref:Uncharacterized protein n=1 Tax=Modicella reniformis TaxID=1440133 RepID=A0A9P6MGV2_9FUNG|nr:hypothetical protein BGZ65_004789 [Modicella reniformis]